MTRFKNPWTYGNQGDDKSSPERIERIRNWTLLEAEYQFASTAAPEMRAPLYDALARHIADSPHHLLAMANARQSNIRLLLSVVHHLMLLGDPHRLSEWFPTVGGTREPNDELIEVFEDFVASRASVIEQSLQSRGVQTNEVRRCAALWCQFTVAAAKADRPLALIELGCSSGLNLMFDRYAYLFSDGRTAGDSSSKLTIKSRIEGDLSPPVADEIPVVFRVGVDRDPVDLFDGDAISWQRACIWADHVERLRMFDSAVEIARQDPPKVLQGDMVDVLPSAFELAPSDAMVCVYGTAAVSYLRRDRREALAAKLLDLSRQRPILWVTGEGPGVIPGAPVPEGVLERVAVPLLVSEVTDGSVEHHLLGITGAHGVWIEWWQAPA
jgi:hypothetical protein